MCWVSNLVNKTRNYELHYFLVNIPYVDITSTSEAVSILCISSVFIDAHVFSMFGSWKDGYHWDLLQGHKVTRVGLGGMQCWTLL
jgi:hypothetical protein